MVRLSWSVNDSSGTGVTVTLNGIGTFGASGFVDISQPQTTTTYVLTARNGCGNQSTAQTIVTAISCPAPVINSFSANPNSVFIGGSRSVRLSWSVSDPSGTGVTITVPGVGTFGTPNGFVDISQPQSTTTYTLVATVGCGTSSSAQTVVVASSCPAPTVSSFTATPGNVTIGGGQTVRLSWNVADNSGTSVSVSIAGIGTFGPNGFVDIPQPQSTTTYNLTATAGCGAQATAQATVTASACPAPSVSSFSANPSSVTIGGAATVRLSWNVIDNSGTGVSVSIAGIGTFGPSGFVDISQPQSTTTYNLTATSGCGASGSAQTTVTASVCPTPTINTFMASPAAVRIGGSQTVNFSWNVTDAYGFGVTVTISGVGTFFATSGTASIPQPQSTTTYNLHVTNACGAANDAFLTINASPQTVDYPQPDQGPFQYTCPAFTAHIFEYSVGGTIELTRDGDDVILRFFPTSTGESNGVWWDGAIVNGVTLRTNTPGVTGDFFIFRNTSQFNITSYRFFSPPGSSITMTLYVAVGGADCTDDIPVARVPFDASFPTF